MLMIAALLMTADVAAQAAPTEAAPAAPAPVAKPKKERKICRDDEETTGSHFRKRICLTQSEWDRRNQGMDGGDLKTLGAH